ncbi:5508_t:CDS:10 [Entrophospora sp. SA101]|nr:5508_t:CDS:10 [Entrophospora sp. SA101]
MNDNNPRTLRDLNQQTLPLIPTEIIAAPTQRLLAVSTFVALLAIKILDFFNYYYSSPEDKSILASSTTINYAFLQPASALEIGVIRPLSEILSLKTEKVRAVSSEEDIKIENDDKFCIDSSTDDYYNRKKSASTKMMKVPILFNKTSPINIKFKIIDFETGLKTFYEYKKKDIQNNRFIDVIQDVVYVYLPVFRPGVYQLDEALDDSGMGIKIYKREAIIPHCPKAIFLPKSKLDLCINDDLNVNLILNGVPPLNVIYERRVKFDVVNMSINDVMPSYYTSTITAAEAESLAVIGNYEWVTNQQIEVPLNLTADTIAIYRLTILQVQDFLNNTRVYTKKSHDLTSSIDFNVNSRPTASFYSESTEHFRPQKSAIIYLVLTGHAPWKVQVGYWTEGVDQYAVTTSKNPDEILDLIVDYDANKLTSISVNKSGTYKLLGVNDEKCSGQILIPSMKSVLMAFPPTVKIETIPIPAENCPGEVGLEVILTFTGVHPWHVEYAVTFNGTRQSKLIKSEKKTHTEIIKPDISGEYRYEFYHLYDNVYREGVKIDNVVYTQKVHPKPIAFFKDINHKPAINTCVGNYVEFVVNFLGSEPFVLTYEVVFNSVKRNSFTVGAIEGPSHAINSPQFNIPGVYSVVLTRITDVVGCSQKLNESNQLTINVKKDKPTAGFQFANELLYFREGESIELPLQLTGNLPWDVGYRHLDYPDNLRKVHNLYDHSLAVKVSEPGKYELMEVKDAYCYGNIIPEMKETEVMWLPRPTLNLVEGEAELLPSPPAVQNYYKRKNVCEGVEDSVGLVLQGRAPWTITYQIVSEKIDQFQQQTIGFPTTRLHLNTGIAGHYIYNFTSISDDIYRKATSISLLLEQDVVASPKAQFVTKDDDHGMIYHCVNLPFSKKDSIKVRLQGLPPFGLVFDIIYEAGNQIERVNIEEINDMEYYFLPNRKFSLIGNYTVSIIQVVDANGCSRLLLDGPDTRITIQITDVATIERSFSQVHCTFPQQVHCVGDLLLYSLRGIPPWNITYIYDNQTRHAISKTSRFIFGADKPGNMTISEVCHQNNECCSYPTDLIEMINDLPTAIVSEGKEVIEDIREGDKSEIIVDLIGTPPFRFTYTRRELLIVGGKRKQGRVLEVKTVTNINEHKYSIYASQEGIFQVIHIGDRYCEYPKNGTNNLRVTS